MNHHLSAALTSIGRTLSSDCTLTALLAVQDRVQIALKDKERTQEIKDLIQSCRTATQFSNENQLEIQRKNSNVRRNRHHYEIQNNKGEALWVCGMSEKMRRKVPNYSDKVVLGAFLAGVDNDSVEKAVIAHSDFIGEMIGRVTKNFQWYMNESFESLKNSDSLEDWQIKNFKRDLGELSYPNNALKQVIQFDCKKESEKLNEAIKRIIKSEDLNKNSKEFKDFEIVINEVIDSLNKKITPQQSIKKQTKRKIK